MCEPFLGHYHIMCEPFPGWRYVQHSYQLGLCVCGIRYRKEVCMLMVPLFSLPKDLEMVCLDGLQNNEILHYTVVFSVFGSIFLLLTGKC